MKSELRQIYKQKRREMNKTDVADLSIKACKLFLESDFYKNSQVIMLYKPLGNETDTSLIENDAVQNFKKLCYPVTDKESGEITAVYGDCDTTFLKGAFSINEPQNTSVANKDHIDVVLVPGIVYSPSGDRIGFGKGCYDRFLNKFNGVKIGFCFESQITADFSGDNHDIKMDYLITDKRIINCRKGDVK